MQDNAHSRGGASATPPRLLPSFLPRLPGLAELALWIFAVGALGSAGWMQLDAYLYQRSADKALVGDSAVSPAPAIAPRERAHSALPRKAIPAGTPIARLIVPRLGISVVVAEGTDSTTLRRAIGRIPSSAMPGEPGNVALAGHRDTFLRPLADIRAGDTLVLESPSARYAYRVESIEIVEPHDTRVLGDADYPALTIVTCYPFRYVGPAPQRFVVHARQIEDMAQDEASCPDEAQQPLRAGEGSCGGQDSLPPASLP